MTLEVLRGGWGKASELTQAATTEHPARDSASPQFTAHGVQAEPSKSKVLAQLPSTGAHLLAPAGTSTLGSRSLSSGWFSTSKG